MLILPSITQLNEVIKTSQAILNSPAATAIRFASSMRHLLNAVYSQRAIPIDPLDVATTIVPHVTADANYRAHIKYSKVKITWGDLQPADRITANPVQGGITFTWRNNAGENNAQPGDKSILIAYCKSWNRFRFNADGAERKTGKDTLALPDLRAHKVHTWLGFISADGQTVSNSVYTGWMQVL